jgi:DNA-binding transcriptional LysR family regulator
MAESYDCSFQVTSLEKLEILSHIWDNLRVDLNEMFIFAKVVQTGSFIAASRDLGIPKSTVSRKLAELEARLGARLLQRTTRKLSLTDAGRIYFQHAARVVAQVDEAEQAIHHMQDAPRGLLRISVPLNMDFLGPIVSLYLQTYPEVEIEIICTDRRVDLVHEGFDLAIRAGTLTDSTLVARNLGVLQSIVVASPVWIANRTALEDPSELQHVQSLVFGAGPEPLTWNLQRDGEHRTVMVKPRLIVNDFDLLAQAAATGLGVAMMPWFRCTRYLKSGALTRILSPWCSPGIPLSAIYSNTRYLSPKVRTFVEHLREQLNPPPWSGEAGLR